MNANPNEPDLVRDFFLYGLEEIEDEWNAVLATYHLSLRISGVFSHQTPKVEPIIRGDRYKEAIRRKGIGIPVTKICELGDLLFIVLHADGTAGCGNAFMLQAKKGFPASSDSLQRILYEHANQFEYKRSTAALNGGKRFLTPKDDMKLAYWDLSPKNPSRIGETRMIFASDARIDLNAGCSFGDALTQLVFGAAGTGFSLSSPGGAWGKIIADLIGVTAKRILSKATYNARGVIRGVGIDELARMVAASGNGLLVRNSLADALIFLSKDFEKAAGSLSSSTPLLKLMDGRGGEHPPFENRENFEDDEGDGMTVVFIKCGSIE